MPGLKKLSDVLVFALEEEMGQNMVKEIKLFNLQISAKYHQHQPSKPNYRASKQRENSKNNSADKGC